MKQKLIPMTDYVNQILTYVTESGNHKRGIDLINWYSELIQTGLSIDMFVSVTPLFYNFTLVESQKFALDNQIKQSVFEFGENEFGVTTLRKHELSKNKLTYVTSYHLKTVEDLCKMDLDFNNESEYYETDLFD